MAHDTYSSVTVACILWYYFQRPISKWTENQLRDVQIYTKLPSYDPIHYWNGRSSLDAKYEHHRSFAGKEL